MPHLFSPIQLRDLTLHNRIVMSPMCTYTAGEDGLATGWHLAHYLSRAVGRTALIVTEATAVESRGRISAADLGLWRDEQIAPQARIVDWVHAEGAAIGVQLAHAGRKAWSAHHGFGPHTPVAPSALPFAGGWQTPEELSPDGIAAIVDAWRAATVRAEAAGFDLVEIHAAHGYLSHQFLSPISNHRQDDYGGSPANRMRFLLQVVDAVRSAWPAAKPVFVRVSATDWAPGGLAPDDLVVVARELATRGIDLVDCSSGGTDPDASEPAGPGYQIPFAEQIRREAGIATAAVGLISTPELADEVIRNGRADLVFLGRELLRHPYWPLDAARTLGHEIVWPRQYRRAKP